MYGRIVHSGRRDRRNDEGPSGDGPYLEAVGPLPPKAIEEEQEAVVPDVSDDAVLAHTRHEAEGPSGEPGETLLCVANLADSPRCVSISLPDLAGRTTTDVLGGAVFPTVEQDGHLTLTLGARGYYWLTVDPETQGGDTMMSTPANPRPVDPETQGGDGR